MAKNNAILQKIDAMIVFIMVSWFFTFKLWQVYGNTKG
jgi:hypothetical protein